MMKRVICIILALCVIISIGTAIYIDLKNVYNFSKIKWNAFPYKRELIVDDFLKKFDIKNMTKGEIIKKLGTRECKDVDDYLVYVLNNYGYFLAIRFDESGNVVEYKFKQDFTLTDIFIPQKDADLPASFKKNRLVTKITTVSGIGDESITNVKKYDYLNNLISDKTGNLQISYTYDLAGNVISQTDANGNVTIP